MKKMYIAPEFKFWSAEELNSIEAKMSGASSSMIGDKSRPYKFAASTTITINGLMDYWLKCTIDGAAKFTFEISQESEVAIYRSANNLLDSFAVESGYYIFYKNSEISNGENTYLIRLRGNSATTTVFTVLARKNRDEISRVATDKVIKWTPVSESVKPESIFSYKWIYYAKGKMLHIMKSMVDDDKGLKILDGASFLAEAALPSLSKISSIAKLIEKYGEKAVIRAISPICKWGQSLGLTYLLSIRTQLKTEIDRLGEYNSSTNSYPSDKGIRVDLYYIRTEHPEAVTKVELWDGITVYGANGIVGQWDFVSGEK